MKMVNPDLLGGTIDFKEDMRNQEDLEFDEKRVTGPAPGLLMSMESKDVALPHDDNPTLSESVRECVERYIDAMGEEEISNLYELVLSEVEAPLIQSVLDTTRNNQSKTALMLGLNRGTLRKKLRKYGML